MLLNAEELGELISLAVQTGLCYQRNLLLEGFPKTIRDELPTRKDRIEQLRSDLEILNRITAAEPELPIAPLEIWIKNAVELLQGTPEQALLYTLSQKLIERRSHKTQSAPPPPADMPRKGFYFWNGNDLISDPFERIRSLIGPDRSAGDEPEHPTRPGTPERHPSDGKTPEPPARIVNTGFAEGKKPRDPVDSDHCLHPSSTYYFWVEVGQILEKSIERKPTALPAELLPEDAELTVVLFTNPNGFELDPNGDLGKLLIEARGPVVVKKRAALPRGVPEDDQLLKKRLFFEVQTPEKEGTYFLRLCIYFENALVQSRHISAKVAKNQYTRNALQSEVDYTLSRSLRKSAMDFLRGHQLSIFMNEGEDGTHGFRLLGEGDYHQSLSVDGQEVQNLIVMLRNTLKKACWGEEADWTPKKDQPYRYESTNGFPQLQEDLILMAKVGYRAYTALADRLGGTGGKKQLRELMRLPRGIQFALKQSTRLYLPIALFYDHKLDSHLPEKAYSLCDAFKQAASNTAMALENSACFQGNCPNRDSQNIVCPSGFWGFRHALGLPVSLGARDNRPPQDLENVLPGGQSPSITVSVCNDPNMQFIQTHVEALEDLVAPNQWRLAQNKEEAIRLLKEQPSHVVYFYCHGGVDRTAPFLQIGPTEYDRIGADTLTLEEIEWPSLRSLVFINGCHTTDLEPERAIDLVSGFVTTARASGVIGTEITIFEPLAVSFSQWFFQFFLKEQKSVGESIRLARLRLLQRELNPLGLVYIPFAASTLKISSSASASQ